MSRGGNRFWSDSKRAAALLQEQTVLKREELVEEKTGYTLARGTYPGKDILTLPDGRRVFRHSPRHRTSPAARRPPRRTSRRGGA